MGRILRRRRSTQEDSENVLYGRLETKRKQKTSKLKGVTKENKSPALVKKSPIVNTAKRMALVDKTNKSSPPRDLKRPKVVPLRLTDSSNLDKSSISAVVVGAKSGPPAVSTDRDDENKQERLKENRIPKYRVAPVERPVTRSRKQVRSGNKDTNSQETGIVQKKAVKRKVDDGGESFKTTVGTEVQELQADVGAPKASSIQPRYSLLGIRGPANTSPLTPTNHKLTDSVLELKISSGQSELPNTFKDRTVRKRKQADVRKEEQAEVVNEKEVLSETGSVGVPTINVCAYCRGPTEICSCVRIDATPLSSTKIGLPVRISDDHSKLEKSVECSRNKDTTLLEPTPSCSRSSDLETPFRKPKTPKLSESKKSSPKPLPKVLCPSIFSIFKKPDTPRRNSTENKIFVSGSKQTPSTNLRSTKHPVYSNKNMTPLGRRNSRAPEQKEELYEFEVDENEPKPKKKRRPIMKIQRLRAHKKNKPKMYVPDPDMERRLLRNLDLSPSVLEQMKMKKTVKVKVDDNQPSTSTQGVEIPVSDSQKQTDSSVEDRKAPSSDGGIYDVYMDDDHHGEDYGVDPSSSPCSKYGSSTPLYSALNKSRDSLLDDSIHRFGGLSAKLYSPVKSKPSPMPVLLEDYNNDPVRNSDSDRRSVVSNGTAISAHSSYQHDLDVSASTPVKFHKHDSTSFVSKRLKPEDLNVSNCFGFDVPEEMEEPLVSPIKTTVHVPPPAASPAHAALIDKKKLRPPIQSAPVDVDEVIKKLRAEVGENSTANLSVFDEDEIMSPRKRSPMKRYLQSKVDMVPEKVDEESSVDAKAGAAKIPRLSYERPRLRKRVAIAEQSVADKSVHFEASDEEVLDSDDDREEPKGIPYELPAHKTVKPGTPKKGTPKKKRRGMTKKEEEELEKWAKMFNSQCDQVEGYGLCVE